MRDFSYYNPTRLIFGRGAETKAAEAFRPFAGEAGRVLLAVSYTHLTLPTKA